MESKNMGYSMPLTAPIYNGLLAVAKGCFKPGAVEYRAFELVNG